MEVNMERKFNNPRYATKGISAEVPLMTQIIMWGLVDSMKVENQDYLQVFTLTADEKTQRIEHHQEVPEYRNELSFPAENPVNAKVFVIDDETHSTMLLAEEY
jgi:hypothetical protein